MTTLTSAREYTVVLGMKDASLHPESDMNIEAEEWRQTIMNW
jgi:hypothetical protein